MALGEHDIYKIADDLGNEGIIGWMAYHQLNPFGQDVEDMRFQALRADINYNSELTRHDIRGIFGNRNSPPQPKQPSDFPIWDRFGKSKKRRTFLDMTQEEIAESMRCMDKAWSDRYS